MNCPFSGALKQYDTREPMRLFASLLGHEASDQRPEPREAHGPLQTDRLVPRGAELRLPPAVGLEEARPLGGGKAEWRVAGGENWAPRLLDHLEQSRRPEVDEPPPERRRRGEVGGERRDLFGREINEQALAYHQDVLSRAADAGEQRAAGGLIGEVDPHPFERTNGALLRELFLLVGDDVREIDLDPPERRRARQPLRARVQSR